jgi:hypothetical protein
MSNTKAKQVITESVTLATIQSEVKAPKGKYNSFGKYKYRSAEDIVEAVKPIIHKYGYWLTMNDEIVHVVGTDRLYIKATIVLSDGTNTYTTSAFAREEESKKGMDGSQITGASSSYARKYALAGLFALDNETPDSDATNTHGSKPEVKDAKPEMTDTLMMKLLGRYMGGELDVFKKAQEHYTLREKDVEAIESLPKNFVHPNKNNNNE